MIGVVRNLSRISVKVSHLHGCPGVVWETLPNVGDALSNVREWSEDPPGFAGVVGMPF